MDIFIHKLLSVFPIACLKDAWSGSKEIQSNFQKTYTTLCSQLVFIKHGKFIDSI